MSISNLCFYYLDRWWGFAFTGDEISAERKKGRWEGDIRFSSVLRLELKQGFRSRGMSRIRILSFLIFSPLSRS